MNDFLRSAEEQLKFNKDKSSVMAELEDHVETKQSFFKSIGYGEATSAEKANEAMGNGEIVGQRLNQIHSRMRKTAVYLIASSVIANIALNAAILLADNSDYSIPFAAALFILLCNLAFTYAAMKFKSLWLSAALLTFSCAAVWLSSPYLAYPLCNLIISDYGDDLSKIYSLSGIVISVCLSALTFLPNAFNIYHCGQMKRLKNTKKQNRIAATLRNACFIIGVLIFVLSFPYYAMNNSLCEEQARIRDEFMDFAFEAVNEYDFKDKDELEEFLENSKYDFDFIGIPWDHDPVNEPLKYTYVCRKGNWKMVFVFQNEDYKPIYSSIQKGVSIKISSILFNVSQRYLIPTDENGSLPFYSALSSFNTVPYFYSSLYSSTFHDATFPIGHIQQDSQDYPERPNRSNWFYTHTATAEYALPMAEKIQGALREFPLMGISLFKSDESVHYTYTWQKRNDFNHSLTYNYDYLYDNDKLNMEYYITYDYSSND